MSKEKLSAVDEVLRPDIAERQAQLKELFEDCTEILRKGKHGRPFLVLKTHKLRTTLNISNGLKNVEFSAHGDLDSLRKIEIRVEGAFPIHLFRSGKDNNVSYEALEGSHNGLEILANYGWEHQDYDDFRSAIKELRTALPASN